MESQHKDEPLDHGGDSNNNTDQPTTADSNEHTAPNLQDVVPQFETVNGSYHFTLTGYSLAKGRGVGKYFSSGTFLVGGHEWAIYFYPHGKHDDDQSLYVSVFIVLVSDSFNVQTLFEMTLLDQSGKGKHMVHSHFDRQLESPCILKWQGSMWGYKRFYKREELEQSDYLKHDTLAITGRVGVLLSSIKTAKLKTAPASPLSSLQSSCGDEDEAPKGSKVDGTQVKGSQSDDAVLKKFEGLRIEDELARYYRKLKSEQSSGTVSSEHSESQAPAVN